MTLKQARTYSSISATSSPSSRSFHRSRGTPHGRADACGLHARDARARGGGCRALCGRNRLCLLDGTGGLQIFKLELKLFDLAEDLLALGPEEHALELLNQQRQALDLTRSRGKRFGVSLMLSDQQRLGGFKIEAIEIRKRDDKHERSMP